MKSKLALVLILFLCGCTSSPVEKEDKKVEDSPTMDIKPIEKEKVEVNLNNVISQLNTLTPPFQIGEELVEQVKKVAIEASQISALIPGYETTEMLMQVFALGLVSGVGGENTVLYYIQNDTDSEVDGYDDFVLVVYDDANKVIDQQILPAGFTGFAYSENWINREALVGHVVVEETDQTNFFGSQFRFNGNAFEAVQSFNKSFEDYKEAASYLESIKQ